MLGVAEGQTVVAVGGPTAIRGTLQLHNQGKERLLVREATARLKQDLRADVSFSVKVPAGEARRAKVSIAVDPTTPPGDYEGELILAGVSLPLLLTVVEVTELEIQPRPIVISEAGGGRVRKRVALINRGNVPLVVGDIGTVAVSEEIPCQAVLAARVAPLSAGSKSIESLFAEFVSEPSRYLVESRHAINVCMVAGEIILPAGESRPFDLEVDVPAEMKVGARYFGRAPIYNADLEFVVVPRSATSPP